MDIQILNYLMGVITTGITLLLVVWFFGKLKRPKAYFNTHWKLLAVISSLCLSILLSFYFPAIHSLGNIWGLLILSGIIAPILEEWLYRRGIFQILLEGRNFSWNIAGIAIITAIALYLAPAFLFAIGGISDRPSFKNSIFLILFYFAILIMNISNNKLVSYFQTFLAFFGQAIIFSLIHTVPMKSHIITAILYAALYYFSGEIYPSILAHMISNIYLILIP